MENTQISLIGTGNVGSNLAASMRDSGIYISHVYHRNPAAIVDAVFESATQLSSFSDLPAGQLALVCVPDDAVAEVISAIPLSIPVAYTSGSIELKSLPERTHCGVFYPLQSFTKGRIVPLDKVPFFIEANNKAFGEQLTALAKQLSTQVNYATSEERKKLHLSAVFVNNFTNHILYLAEQLAQQNNVNFEHLKPLLHETIQKLETLSMYDAQTGPARRGDIAIIEAQADKLEGTTKEIYQLLSKSIQQTYLND